MTLALLVAAGYLSGSIPFGLVLTRFFAGKDVRASGSGNIGATNVARVAGKKLGAVVLLLDALKGTAPVVAALWLLPGQPLAHGAVALAAFLGHVFPVWLKFAGGKGVATALGVLVVLVPWAALAGFVVWVTVLAIWVSSIGSLAGAVVARRLPRPPADRVPGLAAVLAVLMVFTTAATSSGSSSSARTGSESAVEGGPGAVHPDPKQSRACACRSPRAVEGARVPCTPTESSRGRVPFTREQSRA